MGLREMTYTTHQRHLAAFLFLQDHADDPLEVNFEDRLTATVRANQNSINETDSYLQQGARLEESITELRLLLTNMDESVTDVQTIFYDVGKKHYGTDKAILREWFRHMYLIMFQKNDGARWGKFVDIVGMDTFLEMLEKYSDDPMRMEQ